jgi:drug/metabolite transporter (DMT)-like permease
VSTTAILLIVLSVVMHVGWNAVTKRQNPSAAFFLLATACGTLLLAPGLILYAERIPLIPAPVWWTLLATGFCQALYMIGLAAAYRAGDMSVAYPLARSIPPILVALAALPLGRAERIDPLCVVGIAVIAIGALLIPRQGFRYLRWSDYWTPCCALALVAAVGTAGYSLLDDHGLRLLREHPRTPFPNLEATWLYATFEGLSTALFLGLWVSLHSHERAELSSMRRSGLAAAAQTGAGMYVGYALVLGAMAFVSDVSYVVGFRQLSVPLGALVGVYLLGEPGPPAKWVGVGLCFVGLLLVAFG